MKGICEARSALFRRVEWIITHSRRHRLRDVRGGGCADDDVRVRSRLRVLVHINGDRFIGAVKIASLVTTPFAILPKEN